MTVATTEPSETDLYSEPAEKALLGAILRDSDAMVGVLRRLPGSDFYSLGRGVVWDTCRAMSEAGEPIDPASLPRRLMAAGQWDPNSQSGAVRHVVQVEMIQASGTFPPVDYYADTIIEFARRRELIRVATRLRQLAVQRPGQASAVLAEMRAELDAVVGDSPGEDGPLGWDQLVDEFEQAHAPGGSRPAIPTPWWELDEVIGGLFGGRVYVFGGRPGQGKSSAALNIATHAAVESGKQILVISKEMPTVDVTGRILAAGAEVPLLAVNTRRLDDIQMARIRQYVKHVGRPGIAVDDKPRSLAGIKTLARAHKHRHGLDVLAVDYLQLVHTDVPSRSRQEEVAAVSRELKALAMELDCAVVLPAQLNRASTQRADQRPTMADLRDSGQIEQDADAVILLHREKNPAGEPTGQILFILDKNRHGPTAELSLRWHGGYGSIG